MAWQAWHAGMRCSSWCRIALAMWISSNRGVLRRYGHPQRRGRWPHAAGGGGALQRDRRHGQCNGSSSPSAILRQDGTFWVVTAGGLSTVDPQRLQRFRERPSPPARDRACRWMARRCIGKGRIATMFPGAPVGGELCRPELPDVRPDPLSHAAGRAGCRLGRARPAAQRRVRRTAAGRLHPACGGRPSRRQLGPTGGGVELHRGAVLWQRRSVQVLAGMLLLAGLVALYRLRCS